ncbi:hypothetical protein BH11BAC6_BH11BAC6_09730 [soil metagenome]
MNYALLLLPFLTSFLCWLIFKLMIRYIFRPLTPVYIAGIKIQGFLPRNKTAIAAVTATAISTEILKDSFITEKLTSAEALQKVMPAIDRHIDNFLNHKLKEAIPVITMFIGDKITLQLKELFLKELEELFPSVMSQIIGNLSQNEAFKKEIVVKLQHISIAEIEKRFYATFKKKLRKIGTVFALGGLIAGIIQLLLTLLIL